MNTPCKTNRGQSPQTGQPDPGDKFLLSVITPAYNEQDNLPVLFDRLREVFDAEMIDWEWIIVDDHSADHTFEVIGRFAAQYNHVRGVRFSRNFGSHAALSCGLLQAAGDCAVVLAADLQDPPEIIPQMLAKWHNGQQVVWAVRNQRLGESWGTRLCSRIYYFLMRHLAGQKNLASKGADFFLLDRTALEAANNLNERNASMISLISWMGFRQARITYDKMPRLHGVSGWSFHKRLKLTIDSLTSFTYAPIRFMSWFGLVVATIGFVHACVVIVNKWIGTPVSGYPSLMVAVLVIGGLQMVMLGILGEYLWRALESSRSRPRFLIEATTAAHSQVPLCEDHALLETVHAQR